jgi:DNA-directed RNA polymerase subunit N (RpoN/RPB10)
MTDGIHKGESEMKINCVSCGHTVDLDDAYDGYEGPIKCFVCGELLEIKTEEGNLKAVRILPRPSVGNPFESRTPKADSRRVGKAGSPR